MENICACRVSELEKTMRLPQQSYTFLIVDVVLIVTTSIILGILFAVVFGLLFSAIAHARPAQASVYWEDKFVATGQRFDPMAMSAAHRDLPFGTKLTVCYRGSHRCIVVKINDRGPAAWTRREIDLTRGAARALHFPGTGKVDIKPWPPLPRPRPNVLIGSNED